MNSKVYILGLHLKNEVVKERAEHHKSDAGALNEFYQ